MTPLSDVGGHRAAQRQKALNRGASEAPWAADVVPGFDPRVPTGEVFGDLPAEPAAAVKKFLWHERPSAGWPEGYDPFSPPPPPEPPPEVEEEPEPDWQSVEAAVREQGYEEGYAKGREVGLAAGEAAGRAEGFAAGRAEGFAVGRDSADATFRDVGAAVDDLRAAGAELESRYVRAAVELGWRIAGRLVGRIVEEAPELLVAQVGAAIRRFRGAESAVVWAHPDDVPALEAATELRRGADGLIDVSVQADASLARGGWRVDTHLGGVDGDVDARVRAIAESLAHVHAAWDEPSAAAVVARARAGREAEVVQAPGAAQEEDDDAPLE